MVRSNITIDSVRNAKEPKQLVATIPREADLGHFFAPDKTESEGIAGLFQVMINRQPTAEELARVDEFLESAADQDEARRELAWALTHHNEAVRHVAGIFKIEDGEFICCLSGPGVSRVPTAFKVNPGSQQMLVRLRRPQAPPTK